MLVGIGAALAIVLLEALLFAPRLGEQLSALATATPAPWQGLLAALYGGIVEELLLRLGLMTTLVWLGTRLTRASRPSATLLWGSNILAALLFGAGHLPAVAMLLPLTPLLVTRTLLLNAVGGLLFGWLYWRSGLLAAMIAHFSADIVLHVIIPLLG